MGERDPVSQRFLSLDQFRGYTVLGMFVVNFVGGLRAFPALLKHHHTYFSYADTIMPQFFFAVGFAYRLTLLRRIASLGWWPALGRVWRRNLGLILLGIIIYHLGKGVASWAELTGPALWPALRHGLKRDVFQTLVHIGVTSLWVLPVIGAGPGLRVAFAILSGLLHLALSHSFYYSWVNTPPVGIDGGPLGFLTWTIPLLAGSLACDVLVPAGHVAPDPALAWGQARRFLAWGMVLMVLGYGLSCVNRITPPNTPSGNVADVLVEPPFVPPTRPVNLWTMSQRSGSLSYLVFASGFSLAVFALFVVLCDRFGFRVGLLDTLGRNALAGYILHEMIDNALSPYTPRDAPLWYGLAALALFLALCYIFLRYLEKQRLFLRL
jgi:predicted acyltransferase